LTNFYPDFGSGLRKPTIVGSANVNDSYVALTSFYIIKSFDSLAVHGFCSKTDVIWAVIDGTDGASEQTLYNSRFGSFQKWCFQNAE
jgi:hypothetical protein